MRAQRLLIRIDALFTTYVFLLLASRHKKSNRSRRSPSMRSSPAPKLDHKLWVALRLVIHDEFSVVRPDSQRRQHRVCAVARNERRQPQIHHGVLCGVGRAEDYAREEHIARVAAVGLAVPA